MNDIDLPVVMTQTARKELSVIQRDDNETRRRHAMNLIDRDEHLSRQCRLHGDRAISDVDQGANQAITVLERDGIGPRTGAEKKG